MNFDLINLVGSYMPIVDNDKIKALCDASDVPHEAVEQIEINDIQLEEGLTMCESCKRFDTKSCTCANGLILEYQYHGLLELYILNKQVQDLRRYPRCRPGF